MVLLTKPTLPAGSTVIDRMHEFDPHAKIVDVPTKSADVRSFDINGEMALVGLMRAPVPGHEADEAAQLAIAAIGGRWKLPPHSAHLIVSYKMGSSKPLASLLAQMPFIAAVTAGAEDAIGVYFGATTQPRSLVLDLARNPSALAALMLWVGVSVRREGASRVSYLSYGMEKRFGFPELFVSAPRSGPDLTWFYEVLADEAESGSAYADGDTIGRSADERWKIRYRPSPLAGAPPVVSIDIPG